MQLFLRLKKWVGYFATLAHFQGLDNKNKKVFNLDNSPHKN
jgi:hypothetical protein